MIQQNQIEEIRGFIIQNKTLNAINSLKDIITKWYEAFTTSISILESDLKRLKGNYVNGIISHEEFNLETRRIHSRIFELIEGIIAETRQDNSSPIRESSLVLDPISRQENIGRYSKLLYDQDEFGVIRQKAALSSFSIPNREPNDPIWDERDELNPRTFKHKEGSWLERKWIENHVKKSYAKLVLNPSIAKKIAKQRGKKAAIMRLKSLLEFIVDNKDKIDIVITDELSGQNIIIVGESFFTYSDSPTIQGYEETYFEWDKEKVKKKIEEFDSEFQQILKAKEVDIYDSKNKAIQEIKALIDEITQEDVQ